VVTFRTESHSLLRNLYSKVGATLRRKIHCQHVIGRFIVDFYCAQVKLVIEIDGNTHTEPTQAAYDAAQTAWLEAQGYHVVCFNNRDVHDNIESVLSAIRSACEKLLRPDSLSPKGRGLG